VLPSPFPDNWGQVINLLTFFIPLLVLPSGGMGVYLDKNYLESYF